MKKLILLVSLLAFVMTADAQRKRDRVSGYLGKRFVFGIGLDLSLSRQPQKMTSEHVIAQRLSLNRRLLGYVDFALGNYWSIGVRGSYSSTSSMVQTHYVGWSDSNGSQNIAAIHGTPGIKDMSCGFHLKRFVRKKASLAPVGAYWGCGVNIHYFRYDFSKVRIHTSQPVYGYIDREGVYKFANPYSSARYPELFGEWGRALPLNDYLLFDFSVKSGLLITGYFSGNTGTEGKYSHYVTPSVKARLLRMFFLSYSVKIALLG